MRTNPIDHKFGHPKPYPVSFGIYLGHKKKYYGNYMWGVFKGRKIEIYDAYENNQKLQYVSDNRTLKWIKSKLIYIQDGIKKVIRSQAK